MNYEFSLTKSGVVSITVGFLVIGVLLFGAGLIVGSQWLISSAAAAKTAAKNEEPALPKEPVLNDESPASKTTKSSAPVKNIATPQQPAAAPPEETAQTATADTKLTADEVRIIQEAAADAENDENVLSEPEYVTVQVGVFLDDKEANRLLKDMERKGYAPSFFSGRDAEARQWYAVRIGAYSDKQQAANAAANFTRQEKMRATVRPLGSL